MIDATVDFEARVKVRCIRLVQDFVREIVDEWKGWLTGSLPMGCLAIIGLVNSDWVHLPLWAWGLLIFVAGLLFAMFRIYRDLRQQRDALHQSLACLGVAGPFILVPLNGEFYLRGCPALQTEKNPNDV